tara:strand:- start:507 stop:704 length:198 start_codon:yes stop_codon:yes gene_type:complete
MSDFVGATDTISPFVAILWVFYPMAALVLIELFLRAFNDDDDDDFEGGTKIRSQERVMVPVPSGA